MRSALLYAFLMLQGIPVQQGGKVTGTLRDSQGMPLPGVRMAAVTRGASSDDPASGVAMAGLAETDEQGRFTLEDIPPGRYSIAAGRLDLQTYYPGTQSLANATILTVGAGGTVSGINFVLNDTSLGRTPGFPNLAPIITAVIPVSVNSDNGGRMPTSADGKFLSLRLESTSVLLNLPIEGGSFVVPGPVATDFRVAVENLPDGFEVKSIRYGSTSIPQGVFTLTAANFATIRSSSRTLNSGILNPSNALALASASGSLVPAVTPPSPLSITIGETGRLSTSSVHVSGYAGTDRRRVYISGTPGIVFSDGSFEFRDVPPGRHLIASVGASGPLATVVIVGPQNLSKVELNEINLLPDDFRDPKAPMPAGDLPPGTIAAPVRITGTIIEETSKQPITEGEMIIRSGSYSRTIAIDENGRFETFKLLPGTYELRLQIFGHSSVAPTVTIEDKDINLEIATRRLF
jgi:hypothetical protein